MATHKHKRYGLLLLCLSVFLWGYANRGITRPIFHPSSTTENSPDVDIDTHLQTSDTPQVLIDKVFTFLAPNDSLLFTDLPFIEEYCYYITLEIVTPHNCMINITMTDPQAFYYEIFNTEVNVSQDDDWFEIPFGTAVSGNYSIIVKVICILNLNIHIQLEREHKCLYDLISPNLLGTLKFYEVSRYTDGMELTHNVLFRTDYSYRVYVGRVSSIAGKSIEQDVATFFSFTDPNSVIFQIYYNDSLVALGDVLYFDFGTATGGVYSFTLTITCKVECVNIAYAITEDHSLSNHINGTTPNPPNNATTFREIVILPSEFIIGMVIVCCIVVAVVLIYCLYQQKKNYPKLPA